MRNTIMLLAALLAGACTPQIEASSNPSMTRTVTSHPVDGNPIITRTLQSEIQTAINTESAGFQQRANLVQPSPVEVLWSFVKGQFPAFNSVSGNNSTNGEPITLILMTTHPSENVKNLWGMAFTFTHGDLKDAPPTQCSGEPKDTNFCCLQSPYPQCLQRLEWNYCDGNDICRNAQRGFAGITIWKSIGKELARSSIIMTMAEIKAGRIPGGRLYFVWPLSSSKPELKDKILLTRIDGDTVDRILAVTHGALGTTRRLRGQVSGPEKLTCSITSTTFADYPLQADTAPGVLYISLGQPTQALMPPGQAAAWSPSLYVESVAGYARVALVPGVRTPLGGANTKWLKFADIGMADPARPFHCAQGVTMQNFEQLKAQMNNSEASLFVFGSIYLRNVFREYNG